MCAAMPAWLPASPAVVMVLTPSISDTPSEGSGIGSQRIGAGGISTSAQGAVRHRPASALAKRPQLATVGRMR